MHKTALILLGLMFAGPASADVIYDNGLPNGGGGFNIQGDAVSDSFVPTASGDLSTAEVYIQTFSANSVSSVNWCVGTSAFGCQLGSGTASTADSAYSTSGGVITDSDTFSLSSIAVTAGATYYLELSGAVTANNSSIPFWSESDGASTGYINSTALALPHSQAFALTAVVPEPLTLSLFGVGLVGAFAMRRKKKIA